MARELTWEGEARARECARAALDAWHDSEHATIEDVIVGAIADFQENKPPRLNIPIGVTKRMRQVCEFIYAYSVQHDYAPSYEEIMRALGLKSKAGVHRLVYSLVDRGIIETLPDRARALRISERYLA